MNLRSGQRAGSSAPPRSSGGADRISALADELLLLVLARLRCVRTAARASVLSSRWRGLWTRLPSFVFRDVALPALAAVLHRVASDNVVSLSLLDIDVPQRDRSPSWAAPHGRVSSLLCAAARLSPERLVLALPWDAAAPHEKVELPRFQRATSITLSTPSLVILRARAVGQLSALTTLVLSGCTADALDDLVPRCPRLRVLRFSGTVACYTGITVDTIMVCSRSLQELVLKVDGHTRVRGIVVATPMLEQLTVASRVGDNLCVSVLAPMAGNVSWHCRYGSESPGLGSWTLERVSLVMSPPATRLAPVLQIQLRKHRDRFSDWLWMQDTLAGEVEKHLQMQVAADLSVFDLELHLAPLGHVYGALASFFLGIHRIRDAIHRLKVVLPEPKLHTDKVKCEEEYCGCEPDDDWTCQTITVPELEEVEIDGFQGDDHEFEFLEHLLRCAPMLTRVILRVSDENTGTNDAKVHDFSMEHPYVECHYVVSSDHVCVPPVE
ncbi:hypothetical protein ZWY2020_000405 [Hordeum vulgare]|nr:hypothetical protein ZWY2020_000405 [Hordeum vulgare]